MTGRDPDEPDRADRGDRGPTGPTGHEPDVDAAFAEIVAGWEREHGHTEWPDDEAARGGNSIDNTIDDPATEPVVIEIDPAEDEGHFVPPEPPPFPRPQPQTVGAVALFVLGLLLLLIPNTIGVTAKTGLILGLLAISGGIVWLLARLRQGPPTDSGWDDGAQL